MGSHGHASGYPHDEGVRASEASKAQGRDQLAGRLGLSPRRPRGGGGFAILGVCAANPEVFLGSCVTAGITSRRSPSGRDATARKVGSRPIGFAASSDPTRSASLGSLAQGSHGRAAQMRARADADRLRPLGPCWLLCVGQDAQPVQRESHKGGPAGTS